MKIQAMNFKAFERGSIVGFFDLRYHGLTVKGCRLMSSNKGLMMVCVNLLAKFRTPKRSYFGQRII